MYLGQDTKWERSLEFIGSVIEPGAHSGGAVRHRTKEGLAGRERARERARARARASERATERASERESESEREMVRGRERENERRRGREGRWRRLSACAHRKV